MLPGKGEISGAKGGEIWSDFLSMIIVVVMGCKRREEKGTVGRK